MVEINFTVEKDANGVFNGLDLARDMIAKAYQLLAAYVDGCPACADDLFTVLANQEMLALHRQQAETGAVPTLLLAAGGEAGQGEAVRQHLQVMRANVEALLKEQREEWGWSSPHQHRAHEQGQ
jgi:hypothetical protein